MLTVQYNGIHGMTSHKPSVALEQDLNLRRGRNSRQDRTGEGRGVHARLAMQSPTAALSCPLSSLLLLSALRCSAAIAERKERKGRS